MGQTEPSAGDLMISSTPPSDSADIVVANGGFLRRRNYHGADSEARYLLRFVIDASSQFMAPLCAIFRAGAAHPVHSLWQTCLPERRQSVQ